jgi:hypothetical protein
MENRRACRRQVTVVTMTTSITTTSQAINMAKTSRRVRRVRGVRLLAPTGPETLASRGSPTSPGCGLSVLTLPLCSKTVGFL